LWNTSSISCGVRSPNRVKMVIPSTIIRGPHPGIHFLSKENISF
jgi:hypothetical protein